MKWFLLCPIALFFFGGHKRALFFAGLVTELAYLAQRGFALGRLPIIGPHDTLVFFSVSIALMAGPFCFSPVLRGSRVFSWGAGGLAGLFALLALPFPSFAMPLPPVLRTLWFELHVSLAFFAYALFAIGALLGVLFLGYRTKPLLDLQYRACLVGYSFFSASMVSGGVWGYYAWGTYWLWTPKELWTVILWLFYSLYLHARLRQWWSGRPSAILGIIGFVIVMFTYLGVSLFMKSSHTF